MGREHVEAMNSDLGNRIIKVNHVGGHGAIQIYSGQIALARFTEPQMLGELR